MNFGDKLSTLVVDEMGNSEDILDTLCDLQAHLTGALALVITELEGKGVDYLPERVCLDIKRCIKDFSCK